MSVYTNKTIYTCYGHSRKEVELCGVAANLVVHDHTHGNMWDLYNSDGIKYIFNGMIYLYELTLIIDPVTHFHIIMAYISL